jgi:hypothetical protein
VDLVASIATKRVAVSFFFMLQPVLPQKRLSDVVKPIIGVLHSGECD